MHLLQKSLLITVLLLPLVGVGQTEVFQHIYGIYGTDAVFTSMCSSHNEGFILAGSMTTSYPAENLYIIECSKTGEIIWSKVYENDDISYSNELPSKVIKIENGYAIVGFGSAPNADKFRIAVFDTLGQPIWVKSYGGNTFGTDGNSIYNDNDNNLIATGTTNLFGAGGDDIYSLLVDSLGDTLWTSILGTVYNDRSLDVIQTLDGNYLICGETVTNGNNADGLLIKVDSTGQVLWSKSYDSGSAEWFNKVIELPNGDLMVCYMIGLSNGGVMRLDSNGLAKWSKLYFTSSQDRLYDMVFDGTDIIVTGRSSYFTVYQILAFKINLDGTLAWSSVANEENGQIGYNIIVDDALNYYVIGDGEEYPNTTGGDAGILVKFDHFGYSSCNSSEVPLTTVDTMFTSTNLTLQQTRGGYIVNTGLIEVDSTGFDSLLCQEVGLNEKQQQKSIITVFPNPTSGTFTVRSPQQGTFIVTDLRGRQVATGRLNEEFSLQGQPSRISSGGIYFVQAGSQTLKLVLAR